MTDGPLGDPRLVTALDAIPGWAGATSADRIGADFGFGGAVWLVRDHGGRGVVVKVEEAERSARALAAHRMVAGPLEGNVPVLLDGWVDERADRGVLLFEHVAPAVQGDVLRPCSLPQAEALIDVVARIHTLEAPDGLARFAWTRWEEARWAARVDGASQRFPDLVGRRSAWLVGEFAAALDAALDRMESSPSALIHGDFHTDNVLWRPGVTPVVLDWSNSVEGPVSRDLLVLVGGGVGAEHRTAMVARYAAAAGRDAGDVADDLCDAAHWLLRGVVGWAAAADRVVPGTRLAATCELGLGALFEYLGV